MSVEPGQPQGGSSRGSSTWPQAQLPGRWGSPSLAPSPTRKTSRRICWPPTTRAGTTLHGTDQHDETEAFRQVKDATVPKNRRERDLEARYRELTCNECGKEHSGPSGLYVMALAATGDQPQRVIRVCAVPFCEERAKARGYENRGLAW